MIDRATIERINAAVDIVEVVSEFVTLRKSGINYKGLCPFHDDKTPSFFVSPTRGTCHCFACGKGGTAVNFLMEHEQMTYPEALKWLARKYNIEIKERQLDTKEIEEINNRESMFVVNEWAKNFFRDSLREDSDGKTIGMQYLRNRNIRDDIMEKFSIGYAPMRRNALSEMAIAKGYKEEFLLATGLCYKKDNGELVDRFAERIIFPWQNVAGRIVAFGARVLDARTKGVQGKYINSPESDIYHKDHELYGIFQAKKAISKEDKAYLVEGYIDVIAMHQCGIENTIANSGTALSVHQAKLLHRFTSNITLLYDGDTAGIKATIKGIDTLLSEGINVKILSLPDGEDPDSYVKKYGVDSLREYIKGNEQSFLEFKINSFFKTSQEVTERSQAVNSMVKSISMIPDPITRDAYLHECAVKTKINESALVSAMNAYIKVNIEEKEKEQQRVAQNKDANKNTDPVIEQDNTINNTTKYVEYNSSNDPRNDIERMIIQCIIRHGERIILENVELNDSKNKKFSVIQYIKYDMSQDNLTFSNAIYNRILSEAIAHNNDEGFVSEKYFITHYDIEISKLAIELATERYHLSKSLDISDTKESLLRYISHLMIDLRRCTMERRLHEIKQQIKEQKDDTEHIMKLLKEQKEVQKMRDMAASRNGIVIKHATI